MRKKSGTDNPPGKTRGTRGTGPPARRDFSVHIKVWIEDRNHELVIGLGRVAMLEAIERTGSLNQAAAELNMSYRTLWGRLRLTEKRLGRPLLVRTTGGREGGGSQLTPLARSIITSFRELNAALEAEADRLFEKMAELKVRGS